MKTNNSELLKQAIEFVKSKKGELPSLSKKIKLDYNWLRKLADGSINDPGVSKIEKILRYSESEGNETALRKVS